MVDGPRVRGVAFRSVYGSLGTLRGKPAQQAALAGVGEELRNGFVYERFSVLASNCSKLAVPITCAPGFYKVGRTATT